MCTSTILKDVFNGFNKKTEVGKENAAWLQGVFMLQ